MRTLKPNDPNGLIPWAFSSRLNYEGNVDKKKDTHTYTRKREIRSYLQ